MNELLVVYITASFREFMDAAGIGVPLRWLQQGQDEQPIPDEVQFLTSIIFPRRGFANEEYALINVRAIVRTHVVETDVYYHTRVKARVAGVLQKDIPLLRIGGPDPVLYDGVQIGNLRKVPSETISVTPASIDVPDASCVDTVFELQLC